VRVAHLLVTKSQRRGCGRTTTLSFCSVFYNQTEELKTIGGLNPRILTANFRHLSPLMPLLNKVISQRGDHHLVTAATLVFWYLMSSSKCVYMSRLLVVSFFTLQPQMTYVVGFSISVVLLYTWKFRCVCWGNYMHQTACEFDAITNRLFTVLEIMAMGMVPYSSSFTYVRRGIFEGACFVGSTSEQGYDGKHKGEILRGERWPVNR